MIFKPVFKGHFLVVGMSGYGKGVITAAAAREYRKIGIPVFLLAKKEDEYHSFPADFKTMDQDRFLKEVMAFRSSRNGHAVGLIAVIDEAWAWKWENKLEEIPNAGRSRGIEMWVQGQRMFQMPPNVRGNCDNFICFNQKLDDDIKAVVKDRGRIFADAATLKKGKFISEIEGVVSRGTAWEIANGEFVSI